MPLCQGGELFDRIGKEFTEAPKAAKDTHQNSASSPENTKLLKATPAKGQRRKARAFALSLSLSLSLSRSHARVSMDFSPKHTHTHTRTGDLASRKDARVGESARARERETRVRKLCPLRIPNTSRAVMFFLLQRVTTLQKNGPAGGRGGVGAADAVRDRVLALASVSNHGID